MIGAILLFTVQSATAGSMTVQNASIRYECETAIVFNMQGTRSGYVQNIENLRRFTVLEFDERSSSAKIDDRFLYKEAVPATLRVEGKYRILGAGARTSAGQEMQVDLVMNFEDDLSPAFQERIIWIASAGAPPRNTTRSGVCKAMVELERKP